MELYWSDCLLLFGLVSLKLRCKTAHLYNLSGQDHLPLPCFLIGNNDVLVKSYESEMIQSGVVGCFNFVFLKKKITHYTFVSDSYKYSQF